MKKFLQKVLGIQTLKLFIVNPANVQLDSFIDSIKNLPVIVILSYAVKDIRVIDTGIPTKKKNDPA